MGWDSFGLPAENAALERGIPAKDWTSSNISQMKSQMQSLGLNFDWSRELSTSSEDYYKWTQWIFLNLFQQGLAYRKEGYINWDPVQKTVLANEQVDSEGRSWRSGAVVERKLMNQWYFKITRYAEELLSGLDGLQWPKNVIEMQKGWIGKTEGKQFYFESDAGGLQVFTNKIELLMGVKFLALAPEHQAVQNYATSEEWDLITPMTHKSDIDRKESKKTVILSQVKAKHPITGAEIPVVVGEYVLLDQSAGCLMGIPGHDPRDLLVAQALGLGVLKVVKDGVMINSNAFDGMKVEQARVKLEAAVKAEPAVNYKMKDWLVSRQRHWGVPVPIIHCDICGKVPDWNLPVTLPNPEDKESWMNVHCPLCGAESKRDSDTLDTFVDSAWYYLRYLDPKNSEVLVDREYANKWTPVDLYIGGTEHAIMHLLYSRFIHKFLRDVKVVSSSEPFQELLTQGLVLGKTFSLNGKYLKEEEAENNPEVQVKYEKMSKSKLNGVSPEEIRKEWGADTLKLAVLFAAPSEKDVEWDGNLLKTMKNWLNSIYNLKVDDSDYFDAKKLKKEVSRAVEGKKLHVAIARLMEYFHLLKKTPAKSNYQEFLIMLYPFAPHLSSELYSREFSEDVRDSHWPSIENP
jgi:leucyl-tRNA synthetase